MEKQKVVILIRDGWGYRKSKVKNAIAAANTPFADKIKENHPTFLIEASGEAVGLPAGFQGNSEVGHITIGTGRVVEQSLIKINKSIADGNFFKKKSILDAIKSCKNSNSSLHIIGLLETEGVHAHNDHLFALLDLCKKEDFSRIFVHIITDGRDSPIYKGKDHLKVLSRKLKKIKEAEVASICGRFYAMDRDNRWDRTETAYRAIVEGVSKKMFQNPLSALKDSYKKESDEFVTPMINKAYKGVKKNDVVLFSNFRTDRTRQLTKAITEKNFSHFKKSYVPVFFIAMTNYYKGLNGKALFAEDVVKNTLGEVVSNNKMKQLRISETEKYAHVTFFFNNQREEPFLGEERIIIPSPLVKTYDKKPQMAAKEVANRGIAEIIKDKYDLVVINLVNADMVGHSNNRSAIIKAVETVDKEAERITESSVKNNYAVLVFADHGNAEDQRINWATSHTTNPVLLSIVSSKKIRKARERGTLADVAPTVLHLLGVKKPKEMLGRSLLS